MKIKLALILFVLVSMSMSAKDKPKVQGNKNVIISVNELPNAFNSIEISDDLEIIISKGITNAYRINADSNLHEFVRFEVIGDVLRIFTSAKITGSKKLEIELIVIDFQYLTLKDKAKVRGSENFNLANFKLQAFDHSSFELEIAASDIAIQLHQNSGGKLRATSQNMTLDLNDRTDMSAEIIGGSLMINMNDTSEFSLEGDAENAEVVLKRSSKLNARKMRLSFAKLNTTQSSDAYINASKSIELQAYGRSNVYIYGKPDVDVKQLDDKAKIIKK